MIVDRIYTRSLHRLERYAHKSLATESYQVSFCRNGEQFGYLFVPSVLYVFEKRCSVALSLTHSLALSVRAGFSELCIQ